jgi:2-oxoglutarate ferredoxin oxidoreductase subunit gamma
VVLPATAVATELGQVKATNMVLLGAMLARRPIVQIETIEAVLLEKLSASKAHLLKLNAVALRRGMELAHSQHETA